MKSFTISIISKVKVLAVLAVIATLSLGVIMYNGNEITLELEGKVTEIVSYSNTVEGFLEKEDINLKEGGYINTPLDTKLEDNMNIIIKNPKSYTITQGRTVTNVSSIYNNVGDILKDIDIILEGKDFLDQDLNKKINPGSNINVYRVKEKIETKEETIPFEEVEKKSKDLERGKTKVVQEGKEGLKEINHKNEYINGELESSEIESEEVIEEPLSHIIEKGTKEKVVVSRGSTSIASKKETKAKAEPKAEIKAETKAETKVEPKAEKKKETKAKPKTEKKKETKAKPKTEKKKETNTSSGNASKNNKSMIMEATAYSTNAPGLSSHTANGTNLHQNPRVIAVDPSVIPLGTLVHIDGYGQYVAADTGGDIKGNRIDIHFSNVNSLRPFGRRNVTVRILN